jgi:hypothetical protein
MRLRVRLGNNSYDGDDEDGSLARLDPNEDTPSRAD